MNEGEVRKADVLERGCGNASLFINMTNWSPAFLEGVDLGAAVKPARKNMTSAVFPAGKSRGLISPRLRGRVMTPSAVSVCCTT